MGSVRAVLRAVPGLFWLGAAWAGAAQWAQDVRGTYVAVFCFVLGTAQLLWRPRSSPAPRSDASPAGPTVGEVVSTAVICLAALGTAAYGWLVVGTAWAAVGGALMMGAFALLAVSIVSLVGAGLLRLLGCRGDR